jgi:hypothetical protein
MAEKKPQVGKLLRVLVAGGVALAGASGGARAEDTPTSADKAGKAAPQAEPTPAAKAAAKDKAKAKHHHEHAKDKPAEKAKAAEARPAESDGGGVKGW